MSTFLENLPRTIEAKVESRKGREEASPDPGCHGYGWRGPL